MQGVYAPYASPSGVASPHIDHLGADELTEEEQRLRRQFPSPPVAHLQASQHHQQQQHQQTPDRHQRSMHQRPSEAEEERQRKRPVTEASLHGSSNGSYGATFAAPSSAAF